MMRVAFVAAVIGASTVAAHPSVAAAPPTVFCDSVVLRPRWVGPSDRILLGRVAFSRARQYQVAHVGGKLPYWSKIGLYVRAGRTSVYLSVPPAWRSRVAITWGTQPVPELRVAGCPSPPKRWNGYAGGFYVRSPACVPLTVRVGDRRAMRRFGLGRSC
jgi:hypothetical protein